MTVEISRFSDIPSTPAVYAMYGGETPRNWVAYVGIARELNRRLLQHLIDRDSSVVTGTSTAGVNIDEGPLHRVVGASRLRG
jgi:excinuclease UvrABC nuclease subunit